MPAESLFDPAVTFPQSVPCQDGTSAADAATMQAAPVAFHLETIEKPRDRKN